MAMPARSALVSDSPISVAKMLQCGCSFVAIVWVVTMSIIAFNAGKSRSGAAGDLHLSEGGPGLYRPGDGVQIGVHEAVLVKAEKRCLCPVPPFVGEHAVQDRAKTPVLIQEGTLDLLC